MSGLIIGSAAPLTLEVLLAGAAQEPVNKKPKGKSKEPEVGGCVFYTDGNCKPSRGTGGYGIHGYLYIDKPSNRGTGNRAAYPTKEGYFDNTILGNDIPSGNPPIHVTHYIEAFGNFEYEVTNNIAELTAAIKALQFVAKNKANPSAEVLINEVLILTDSRLVCDGITEWVHAWKDNGWIKSNGGTIENVQLWQTLYAENEMLKELGVTVEFKWVKGHSGNIGNELADVFASRAIYKRRVGSIGSVEEVIPAQGYWSYKSDPPNVFVTGNEYWFFNSGSPLVPQPDGSVFYHFGNITKNTSGKETESDKKDRSENLGKRIATNTFTVLHTQAPEANLETIRSGHNKLCKSFTGSLVVSDLNTILSTKTLSVLQRYGSDILTMSARESLQLDEQTTLTDTRMPALRSYAAVTEITIMQQHLEHYLKGTGESINHVYTDITDLVFGEKKVKGVVERVLHKHITMALRSMSVKLGYRLPGEKKESVVEHNLSIGLDTPERNMLNRMTMSDVKLIVVTWPVGLKAFNTATILQSEGNTALYWAPYANTRLL